MSVQTRTAMLFFLGFFACYNILICNADESTEDWKDLPNAGDQKGPWVFSANSMPYLLASKYQIVSISEIPHVSSLPYNGFSYYLQRLNELYRCDEVGPGRQYVACWRFQPKIIEGRAIKLPNKLVGSWSSPAVEAPVTWEFTDESVTSSEFNGRTLPCTFSVSGDEITVNVSGVAGSIVFTIQSDTVVRYNSRYYNGRPIVLARR